MGCSASDVDTARPNINTNNYCWAHNNFQDAYIGDTKYIYYKTKHHKRILLLHAWLRRLNIYVYNVPNRSEISHNEDLIEMIAFYITYSAQYETEGNKNKTLIVESNTVTVLPSNGKRIYEFKSLHIQPYGVLTTTKWIDCDYHNNIGGVLNIHCHEDITIDKHGIINLNGAGLTGLEDNDVLIKYGGYCQTTNGCSDHNSDIEDEKAIELSIPKSISKPDLAEFGHFYIAKGGSYFKKDKKHKNIRNNIITIGGVGGGCIALRCRNFINCGSVVANGTQKPLKIIKIGTNRELFYKLKFFANDGDKTYSGFNLKVIDIGMDGTGGCIAIHVHNDFINKGKIQAMKFGDVVIVQTNPESEFLTKLKIGKCYPFPKGTGYEVARKTPIEILL